MSMMHTDQYGTRFWYNSKGDLHRTDGPAVEWPGGDCEWWLNGQRHRVDGPACEYADGDCEWWLNGQRHRVDGPAVEYANGIRAWYWRGQPLAFLEWLDIVAATPQQQTLLRLRWCS
jgi:hypothetical protein